MKTSQLRPVWWLPVHERALNGLTGDWQRAPLLIQSTGTSSLVFAELHTAGYADRRLVIDKNAPISPSGHVFYRKASGL